MTTSTIPELADDVQDQLDRIAQLQIAVEAGKVSHYRPDEQKGDQQRHIMAEGIDERAADDG